LIKVKNISKSFDQIQAVKDISFSIKAGSVFGLLGPNGAGKSTTINIINTLLQPDTGSARIDGLDISKHPIKSKLNIGVVPQEIALYEDLSAIDNLMFWGSLYKISKSSLQKKSLEILELVGLSDRKNDKIKTFSGGMKRRINIASSLLHTPKVLLMDEPTVGVDPQSRNHVFEIIEKLNAEGMTIIYTTHYMEEAERLCDTIAIIDEGAILAQGTLDELKNQSGIQDLISIKLTSETRTLGNDIAQQVAFASYSTIDNTLLIASKNLSNEISSILNQIQEIGGKIEHIDTKKANLESIFLKLTGKKLRD